MEVRNNSNSLNSATPSRPTVPPKPKSQPQPKATVGTQVNLRRKTSPNIRNDEGNSETDSISPTKLGGASNNNLTDTTNSFHISIKSPNAKPALPPKPVTGSITSPKKSLSTPFGLTPPPVPSPTGKVAVKSPQSQSHSPISPFETQRDRTSPHTSPLSERLSGVKPSVRSPPTPVKSFSTRPSIPSSVYPKPPVFQYPSSSFMNPSQRAEASKKSASLGRNFDFIVFSKEMKKSGTPMHRVTPLDLSSCTNKPISLPPSFGKAISFSPENTSQGQPPTPPARKKRPSLSSPDPVHMSEQPGFPSSPQSAPVYAKVDMEKKWEMRRMKESLDSAGNESHEVSEVVQISEKFLINNSEAAAGDQGIDQPSNNSSWLSKYLESTTSTNTIESDAKTMLDSLTCMDTKAYVNTTSSIEKNNHAGGGEQSVSVDKKLTENESFLFQLQQQSVESEQSQEMINDTNANVMSTEPEIMEHKLSPVDENKHSDIESEFEHKLETLPAVRHTDTADINSASTIGGGAEDILKGLNLNTQNREPLLFQNKLKKKSEDEADSQISDDATVVSQIILYKFDKIGSSPSKEDILSIREEADKMKGLLPSLQPPGSTSPCDRRRSWNCSDSSSGSTDSPSSSSSSLRDRISISASRSHDSSWVDEGEISTGALGDLDSDAPPVPNANHPGAISSRRRKIASVFASFGKGSGGSSSSTNGNGHTERQTGRSQLRFPSKGKSQLADAISSGAKMPSGNKIMSDAGISRPLIETKLGSAPQKTQSLPGFEFGTGDGQTLKQSATSPSDNASVSTLDSVPGGSSRSSNATIEDSEMTVTSSASGPMHDDILIELSPKEKKIFQVAREILTTERTFVDVLVLLTVDFPQALKEASIHPLASEHDMKHVLGPLPQLRKFNEMLLSDLEERIRGWRSNPKVADIFVKKGPFLKAYSEYMRDFKALGEYFDEIRKKYPKLDKTVMDFECSDRCQKLGLRHYMLKPVQRMPQYALLLEQYLHRLDESCEDYEDTMKAIRIVRDVADHANEAIRLKENGDQMKRLQERLVHNNEILKADRQIIKEGALEKVCRKGYQPRYFALMTDCLFVMMYNTTAGSSKDLKLRYELPLAGMKVHATPSEDRPNEFSVISTSRSFNLVARTEKEREDWLKALNDAIYANIKKRACSTPDMEKEFEIGKVAPVWIQDTRVTMCQVCTAEFTITFRRHHCRACGKVVCSNCSGNEAPLQYQNCEAARVCDDCYPHLLEEFDKEVRHSLDNEEKAKELEEVRARFKKTTPNVSKRYRHKKSIPQRLEVNSASGAQMSGYLHWREKKSWKRRWFVLSEKVLYVCMASEDVVAYKTIPILGYEVEIMSEKTYEGVDGRLVFKLTHSGQNPMIFQADSPASVEKWVNVMKEATILT